MVLAALVAGRRPCPDLGSMTLTQSDTLDCPAQVTRWPPCDIVHWMVLLALCRSSPATSGSRGDRRSPVVGHMWVTQSCTWTRSCVLGMSTWPRSTPWLGGL